MPVSAVDCNGNAWTVWTSNTTAATNVTAIWPEWCGGIAASTASVAASTASVTIWTQWTGNGYGQSYQQPTPEATEAHRREAAERAKVAAAAKAKARQLLKAVLDRTQRRELEKDGYFHVQTRDGERVYRLKPGAQPERVKGEDGQRWSYCIHPRESFPADDTVAAFKLLLETDEDEFLRIANASRRGALVNA